MNDKFDANHIIKVVEFLQHRETSGVTEVRIFPKDRYINLNGRREYVGKTVSGYYNDYAKLAGDIQPFDGKANIYVTINPVKPALLARAANRLQYAATITTNDDDILADLWFPYDIDPSRPADISSTEGELKAALTKRDEVAEFLSQWAVSIKGMSGNGGHGLIRLVGYPNNQETRQAKEKLMHYLSEKFSNEVVSIDNTVFNMARIWKLYGVMSTKGDNVPDRPHRRAYLEIPEVIPEPVDLYSHLDEIIPSDWTPKDAKANIQPKRKTTAKNSGDYPKLNVPEYLNAWGGEWRQKEKAETTWFEFRKCPLHTDDDGHEWECGLRQDSDGKMGAKCQHEQSYGWQDFKAVLGDPKLFYEKIQRPKKQVKIIPKTQIQTEEPADMYGAQKQPQEVTQPQSKDNKVRDEKRTHHLLFLAKRYHQQKLRRKEILALLQKENEAKCEPALTEAEVDAILDKILPRLQTITAAELLGMDIPEPKWAIPNFVPEGLTILAGRPKVGKSWLALSFCAAVSMGGYALGKVAVEQGETLFIGLEDNYRRLQDRLSQLCENERPSNLHLLTDLPKLDRGGLDVLGEWLDEHSTVRLVVIDTLQKVKPQSKRGDLYSEDYDFTGMLQRFAIDRGIALICVHHTRKAEADYLLDELSGTTGISAGADAILMLKRKLDGHILYRTGRDVDEGEFAVRRDNTVGGWELLGDAKEFAISEQRRAIIEILQEAGKSLGSKEIADLLQKNYSTVRWMLTQMAKDGQIEKSGSKYNAIITNTPNNANTPNTPNNANTSSSVGVLEPDANTPNTSETSYSVASSDSVGGVGGVGGVDTEQQPQISEKVDDDISSCSPEHNGKLSKQLNEYLADCSDKWINLIHDGLKTAKIPLSIATEASRRMSNGDSQGAWQLLRQNGG